MRRHPVSIQAQWDHLSHSIPPSPHPHSLHYVTVYSTADQCAGCWRLGPLYGWREGGTIVSSVLYCTTSQCVWPTERGSSYPEQSSHYKQSHHSLIIACERENNRKGIDTIKKAQLTPQTHSHTCMQAHSHKYTHL